MKNKSNSIFRFGITFIATASTLLAGGGIVAVTPEPSMIVLTAAGVGAIVLIARKKRGR